MPIYPQGGGCHRASRKLGLLDSPLFPPPTSERLASPDLSTMRCGTSITPLPSSTDTSTGSASSSTRHQARHVAHVDRHVDVDVMSTSGTSQPPPVPLSGQRSPPPLPPPQGLPSTKPRRCMNIPGPRFWAFQCWPKASIGGGTVSSRSPHLEELRVLHTRS